MIMTKKDYIKIAEALKENKSRINLIITLCEIFKADNNNFDANKFIDAVDFTPNFIKKCMNK